MSHATLGASSDALVGRLTDWRFEDDQHAVDVAYQRNGIGRELIRRTHRAAGLRTSLILLAAPKAETYYPHIGMLRHSSCWRIERQ